MPPESTVKSAFTDDPACREDVAGCRDKSRRLFHAALPVSTKAIQGGRLW